MKDKFSSGCGGIYIFRNALKPDFPVIEAGDGFNEMLEGAAEPV